MRLQGKIAAVTGGGAGIGLAAAKLFAAEGARVVILEVNAQSGLAAQEAIRAQGGDALFIPTDISVPGQVEAAMNRVAAEYGKLDVLYNNASVFFGKRENRDTQLALDTWDRVLAINLSGLFYCCKYGIPLLRKAGGGSVINTASSAGVIGIPDCDAYTAAKGATVALTRSMAVEYGPEHIRVNCIAPAAILTDMVRESNLDNPSFDEQAFLTRGTPLRRWGLPEDIARIALFLAGDESSYMNGAILVADGGITIQ